MIEVNLLQEDRQRGADRGGRVDPTVPLVYIGVIVVLGALALVNANLAFKARALEAEKTRLTNEMKKPEHLEQLKESDRLQAELDKLTRKQVIINDLITNRIDWSKKLAAIRDNLPSDIWIESIELQTPKNPKETFQTFQIEAATVNADRGFARSAETLESLRNSSDFMAGLTGELEHRQGKTELWDPSLEEGEVARNIWRFTFAARRPLPESEIASPQKKPAAAPTPAKGAGK